MSNNYAKNMKKLQDYNPIALAYPSILDKVTGVGENVVVREGITYFKYKDQYLRLESENRLEESRLLMKQIHPDKDHLILLFGIGNITLLRKLLTETSDGTKVMIFEPNVYVFKYMMKHENLEEFIDSGKMAFLLGDDLLIGKGIILYLNQKWDNLAQNVLVISLPNYYVYFDFQLKYVRMVREQIDRMLKNLGTSLQDMLDGFGNHYRNVDACLMANGISEIKDKYKGYPAIIVASGPSLDKNIKYLKEAKGKALIISCDASLKACLDNGVKPDAIASIERYSPTFRNFYEGKTFDKDIVLFGPTLLWPQIYKTFPGKQILMAKSPSGVEGWWSSHFEPIEFVDLGMSCANVALAAAEKAGCSPIILIGQDLAFTDERVHSDSTHTKFEGENKYTSFQEADIVWEEDIYGGKIRTNIYYNLFRYYFESKILWEQLKIVDATEGGALIKGTEIMSFREAIDKYCDKEIGFSLDGLLEEKVWSDEKALAKYKELIESAKDILKELKIVQDMAVSHYKMLEPLIGVDYEHADEETLTNIVLTMQKANSIVTYIVEEKSDLVSYYQQIIKQTIIYVKKIGNELTGENVKRNLDLQINLMYMIDISSAATEQRFYEMIEFMKKKIRAMEEKMHG